MPSIVRTTSSLTSPPPKAIAWSSSDSPSRSDPCAARAISATAPRLERDVLRRQDVLDARADQRGRQRLQVELQAARQHRHRNLLRVRRRQHEVHVLGRLLERLQHRVERGLRQHVHFVDQVDLVAADRRRVARVVEDLAHVVDAGVRRGVELEQVDEAAGVDRRVHAAQTPHGVAVTPVTQLRLLARMRAIVVLPTPRVPVSRYAWWMRPRDSELASAVTTCSWPDSSANVIGRHLRARTW